MFVQDRGIWETRTRGFKEKQEQLGGMDRYPTTHGRWVKVKLRGAVSGKDR